MKRSFKHILFYGTQFLVGLVVVEVFTLFFYPQVNIYPRAVLDNRFGYIYPNDVTVVHQLRGAWRFEYTMNEKGFRGPYRAPGQATGSKKIITLGDSYTMGIGVNDGEEYPAVLEAALSGEYEVTNLGIPSYALTQQVRAYLEIGRLYQPAYVVLQFHPNDIPDNFNYKVAAIEDGTIEFHDRHYSGFQRVRTAFMQNIVFQKSHLFNFFKNAMINRPPENNIDTKPGPEQDVLDSRPSKPSEKETFYVDLLTAFSREVAGDSVSLILIDVDGAYQRFPAIWEAIRKMEGDGLLTYLDTREWLKDQRGYDSPEGHAWGKVAHEVIGLNLSAYIKIQDQPRIPANDL